MEADAVDVAPRRASVSSRGHEAGRASTAVACAGAPRRASARRRWCHSAAGGRPTARTGRGGTEDGRALQGDHVQPHNRQAGGEGHRWRTRPPYPRGDPAHALAGAGEHTAWRPCSPGTVRRCAGGSAHPSHGRPTTAAPCHNRRIPRATARQTPATWIALPHASTGGAALAPTRAAGGMRPSRGFSTRERPQSRSKVTCCVVRCHHRWKPGAP